MAKGKPILPSNTSNPVGQVARIRRASKAISRQLIPLKKWLIGVVDSLDYELLTVNAKKYEYKISVPELAAVVDEIFFRMIPVSSHQLVVNEALAAYEEGTALASVNLANISDDYTRDITQILSTAPYQRRAALVSARVFEEMKGFDELLAKDLGRTLRQAIEDGVGPLDIKSQLSDRFGISQARAERIARTEITGALRRARLDEAEDARSRLDIRTKMLHLSALSSTTRASHAARHGKLYTAQEVREWYAHDANGINCKCSQVEVLVDNEGNQLGKGVVERERERRRKALT